MEQLTPTVDAVKKAHQEGAAETKKMLEALYPSVFQKVKDWRDIKTVSDVFEIKGINAADFYRKMEEQERTPDEIGHKILKWAAELINPGFKADSKNKNQKKWWPFFITSPGFGFADSGYGYGSTRTCLGSRLASETEAQSDHFGKYFVDQFEVFLTK